MTIRSGEYVRLEPVTSSNPCKCFAVSWRKTGSPCVEPYCSAGWPDFLVRKISARVSRTAATGSDSLSVKPAASEINFGRDSASCISHEIGGGPVRLASSERAWLFILVLSIPFRCRSFPCHRTR